MPQIVRNDYQQADRRWEVKRLLGPFYHLPNQLTVLRFFMGILFFFILSLESLDLALVVLVIATVTDFFDGYLARKRDLISNFGRIADPLVDKIIICGGFIVLVAYDRMVVGDWMAVIIVVRELIIGILRGYLEFFRGIHFPVSTAGRWKMTGQCITLCSIILYSSHFTGVWWARMWVDLAAWFTVSITVCSGLLYLYGAGHLLQKHARGVVREF